MLAANLLLIKSSPEIFLKSESVKTYFNRKLRENIKCALNKNSVPYSDLVQGRGRMYLYSLQLKKAQRILKGIFGIHSTALAFEFSAETLNKIKSKAVDYGRGRIEESSFAVRATRTGEQPFSSQEIERSAGAALLKNVPELKVDLDNPQRTLFIEVRGKKGFCYVEEEPCFGGLPLGVEGAIALFFNGTREDLVCAWLLMKRGCNVFPVAGNKSKKIESELKKLEKWNAFRRFFVTSPQRLSELIEERNILAIAKPDTRISKKAFGEYCKKDKESELPVFRPLLFFEEKKLRELVKTINSLN